MMAEHNTGKNGFVYMSVTPGKNGFVYMSVTPGKNGFVYMSVTNTCGRFWLENQLYSPLATGQHKRAEC